MGRFTLILVVLVLLVGACGGETETDSGASATVESAESTTSTTTTVPITTATTSTTTSTTTTITTTTTTTTTLPPGQEVRGDLVLGFMPWKEGAVPPPPPQSVSLHFELGGGPVREIIDPDDEITIVVDDQPVGGDAEPQPDWEYSAVVLPFTIHLEPGEYDLQSIVVDDAGWNPDSVTLLVGGPTFTVGESPCTYVGAIGFDFYRLPPGTIDDQTDGVNEIMEAFELEGSLYLQPLESGSFILESGNAGLPPEDERPESAADCEPIAAQFDL